MNRQKLIDSFERCKNDEERWNWVIEHKDDGILVYLDNDDTFVVLVDAKGNRYEDDDWYGDFSDYIGWSEGVSILLDTIGIPHSFV